MAWMVRLISVFLRDILCYVVLDTLYLPSFMNVIIPCLKFHLFPVLLSPFGLKGSITGRTYSTLDGSREMLKEWNHFYPIHLNSDCYQSQSQSQGNEPVPPVVEVVLDKICMKYPACYVLVPMPVNSKTNIEKVLDAL